MDRCVTKDICPNIHSDLIVKTNLKFKLFDYILILTAFKKVKYDFKYLNWTEEIVNEKGKPEYSPMLPCLVILILIYWILCILS